MYPRIRELRESRHMTKKAIAEYLCVSVSIYRNYEEGKTLIRIPVIIRLADLYGVSTDYLLDYTDYPTPYPKP